MGTCGKTKLPCKGATAAEPRAKVQRWRQSFRVGGGSSLDATLVDRLISGLVGQRDTALKGKPETGAVSWVGRGSPNPPLGTKSRDAQSRCARLSANGRLGEPSLPEAVAG